MAIKARKASEFVPAPAGTHLAVCVDVVDNGLVRSEFKGKVRELPKITVKWETHKHNPKNGLPYLVQQRYTNSTHPKANLGMMLSSWFGRALTADETSGEFDLESLIGRNALLNVVHNLKDGVTYSNVTSVSPPMEGMPVLTPSAEYVRVVDRPTPEQIQHMSGDLGAETTGTEDDIDSGRYPEDDNIPF